MKRYKIFFAQTALDHFDLIHSRSTEEWGENVADDYIADLQKSIIKLKLKPELGRLRAKRSAPFLMIAARRHYIVYELQVPNIIILAVLHQQRNIGEVIADMTPEFFKAIKKLK